MNKPLPYIFLLFIFYYTQSFAQTVLPTAPPLNYAQEFAVLGGAAVNNSNNTYIYARVGVAPGNTITGFPPGLTSGGLHRANQAARNAKVSARAVYANLVGQKATQNRTGQKLGNGAFSDSSASNGMRIGPGIYKFDADVVLSGHLVLDGQGSPNAVFIFQVGRDFTVDPGSVMGIEGGAQPKNVFFQVGRDVSIGSTDNSSSPISLTGNILAQGNITFSRNSTLEGRALTVSDVSVVTLNKNSIFLPTIVEADLGVAKTVTPGPYYIGDIITYTITVRNTSADLATNVQLTEQLSSKLALVDFKGFRNNEEDNTITFNQAANTILVGNVEADEIITIKLQARIIEAGNIPNNVRVRASEPDPNPVNNEGEATIVVPAISTDLSVDKTIAPVKPEYSVGERVTYTITAKNNGPNNATGVVVTDKLPNSLTLISATATNGNTSYNTTTGDWLVGALDRGATQVLTIVARINAAGTVTNIATISGPQTDQVPGNNTDRVDIPANAVPLTDLSVVKTISPGPYSLNGEVTYTIVATNRGPDNATGVKVTEKLPAGLTFVSATTSPTNATYNATTGIFDIGNLANGASARLIIVTRINTTGNIVNQVTVEGNELDPNENGDDNGSGNPPGGSNEDSVMVCVKPIAPLAITGPANVCAGQTAVVYSVPVVPGATSYTFTLPVGWTVAGGNSNTVVIPAPTSNTTTVPIVVTVGAGSGLISVIASNACGTSTATSLAVTSGVVPAKPGPVIMETNDTAPCSGTTVTYSIAAVTGATSYTWTLPVGWTIVSGQNTPAITAVVGVTAGDVSVAVANTCGTSGTSSLAINPTAAPPAIGPITDNSSPCVGLTYSITGVAGTVYNWVVSSGFTIQSGQGTDKVVITADNLNNTTGTISVSSSNGKCTTPISSLPIDATKAGSQLFFPNAVSPNGDGLYDTWAVKNILNFPDNDVVIYNRWGNEVYRKKAYRNDWAALGLEQGTYYYVFRVKECSGQDKVYKGYITVYR